VVNFALWFRLGVPNHFQIISRVFGGPILSQETNFPNSARNKTIQLGKFSADMGRKSESTFVSSKKINDHVSLAAV